MMTSIICTLDKKNKNSFGVYEIIKKLKKSLLKKKIYYYLINDLNFFEASNSVGFGGMVPDNKISKLLCFTIISFQLESFKYI